VRNVERKEQVAKKEPAKKRGKERQYTDAELLEAVRKHHNLTSSEWRKQKIKPSVRAISKRFGGWKAARKKAGIVEKEKGGK